MQTRFEKRLHFLQSSQRELLHRSNKKLESDNGIFNHYLHPVLTANHTPISWRYDLNYETNPYLMERFGITAVLDTGAIKLNGKYLLIARLEGADGKSYFSIAESNNGVDNFELWDYPITIPETDADDISIYDMRIVQHEDNWIYVIFSIERKEQGDPSLVTGHFGIARTLDLRSWERLPDLKTEHIDQIALHPEFANSKYAFYASPQETPINKDAAGEFTLVVCDDIANVSICVETLAGNSIPNTTNKLENAIGPAPIKTQYGWLHLAHTVRKTKLGSRFVLCIFMTDLKALTNVIYKPGGYFLTPEGDEKIIGIANGISSNGWIVSEEGTVYIYYPCSDGRLHIVTTTIDQLLDYVMNTTPNTISVAKSMTNIYRIIDNNRALMHLKQPEKKG